MSWEDAWVSWGDPWLLWEEAWVLQGYVLVSREVLACPEQDSWVLQEGVVFLGEMLGRPTKMRGFPREELACSPEMLRTSMEMSECRDMLISPGEGGVCELWEDSSLGSLGRCCYSPGRYLGAPVCA